MNVSIKKIVQKFLSITLISFCSTAFSADNVLILYDSGGPFGNVGEQHAIMLQNLLGHFNVVVTKKPVTQYKVGDVNNNKATFYLGTTYDEQSFYTSTSTQFLNYNNFLKDVATTTKTVVWFNYNLWKLAWSWQSDWGVSGFTGKFGINFSGVVNNGYNRVNYKSTSLFKGVVPYANPGSTIAGCVAEGDGKFDCSTELSQVQIVTPTMATVVATTLSTLNSLGTETPYITRAQNLWVFGDIPTSYISEEDRYLALADVLHDILQSGVKENHVAMVRLEDVSPETDLVSLKYVTDYLNLKGIPFGVAAIPRYTDPLGIYNNGVSDTVNLNNSEVGTHLKTLQIAKQASIILHGYTHQYSNVPNPFNGVSGDDFEFYRVLLNPDNSLTFSGPVPGDSTSWAKNRIKAGTNILNATGLKAFAWEAPHYTASKVDYTAIQSLYPVHYGRLSYFSSTSQRIGQFYPYLINKDIYQYRVVPESIGNIEPDVFLGYRMVFPADLIRAASKALVVRDGVASLFYHPFLVPPTYPFYLQEVVDGLQNLGYKFVAPCSLVNGC